MVVACPLRLLSRRSAQVEVLTPMAPPQMVPIDPTQARASTAAAARWSCGSRWLIGEKPGNLQVLQGICANTFWIDLDCSLAPGSFDACQFN